MRDTFFHPRFFCYVVDFSNLNRGFSEGLAAKHSCALRSYITGVASKHAAPRTIFAPSSGNKPRAEYVPLIKATPIGW
ncbi:hypothetical protein ACS3SW_16845 [Roseobacteraceae bacterium S113]